MAGVSARISHLSPGDRQKMRDAGIGWVRNEIHGLDLARFVRGEKQPVNFERFRQKIAELRQDGFQIMALTPGPREMTESGTKPGSPEYYETFRRLCAFLGEEFKGLIDYWQIANELDIWIFRDTLDLEQSVEFLKAGLRGMREAGRDLKIGVNITLFPSRPGEVDGNTDKHEGEFIAKAIFQDPTMDIDYAGFDSYPGSCREGGAESWDEYLDAFHALVKKPIIVQEYGYSSAGEIMTEEENRSGTYPCKLKKWRYGWKGAHSPEVQADFVTESLKVFARKPYVIGATYYAWKDSRTCWECGSADCPIQTAFGLLDCQDNFKPSYHSLKAGLKTYFKGRLGDDR